MKSSKGNIAPGNASTTKPFFNNRQNENLFFQRTMQHSPEKDEEKDIQTKPAEQGADGNTMSSGTPKVRDNGQPLPVHSRSRMEKAFDTDFSDVKIHTDDHAASLNAGLNAHAFALGSDIYFDKGMFNPGTIEGDALLAHELAHTYQQSDETTTSASADTTSLETDADISAIGVVSNLWTNQNIQTKSKVPKLKTGPRISRCSKTSRGPMGAARKAQAIGNFESKNSHLSSAEITKIESAISTTASNIDLEITFFDYYSNHEIIKDSSITGSELALTKPNDDTKVNPSVLAPSYPNNSLGSLLLHELTHTRHDTNFMGTRDYQEGEAYAVEYFFAERTGDTARTATILSLVGTPGTLSVPAIHPALLLYFRKTYASLKILYEVIDTGTTSHPSSPLATPAAATRERARALATELISVSETSRSADLVGIVRWAQANQSTIGVPI